MKGRLTTAFIYMIVITMLSSFWARVLGFIELSNAFYAASLVIVTVKYFSNGLVDAKVLVILILTILSMVDGIRNNAELNIDFFLHAGITSCVFMCISMIGSYKIDLNKKSRDSIILIFILSGIFLAVYYYFGGLKNVKIGEGASLNLDNPNEAGLWMASYVIIYVGSVFALKGFWRIAALATAASLLPILYATDSRNSFYAAVLFAVMIVVTYIVRLRRIPPKILLLLSALPVIVFFFYMYVIVPNMEQWSTAIDTMNKGINSREEIWRMVIDDMSNCFLIGDYAKYCDGQMHNSLMTLYCRYGVVYLICAIQIIYQALKNVSIYAALGLCGLLFTGCFEGALFVGIAGLYLMALVVPILLKNDYYFNRTRR